MEYIYQNKTYRTIYELAKDLYLFEDSFVQSLRTDTDFFAFVASRDEEKASHLENLARQSLSNDVLSFEASYLLNPYMTFRFRKKEFANYQDIGLNMIEKSPEILPYFEEILRFSLLSYRMERNGENLDNPELYEKILAIEKESQHDSAFAYYQLAYLLSKKEKLIYEGVEYENLFNFTYYMMKKEESGLDDNQMRRLIPVLKAYALYGNDKKKTTKFLHLISEREKAKNMLEETIKRKEEEIQNLL